MNATEGYSQVNVIVALSRVNGALLWALGMSVIFALVGVLSWHVGKVLRMKKDRASYLKLERETDSCSDAELFEERPYDSGPVVVPMEDLTEEQKAKEENHDCAETNDLVDIVQSDV